jgi:hypothetical protein
VFKVEKVNRRAVDACGSHVVRSELSAPPPVHLRRTANEADSLPPAGHDHQPLAASAALTATHSLVRF